MIDKSKINEYLDKYKSDFSERWQGEKYKWEAVKCFQDNWDIDASNFADMLERSLAKTANLLVSVNYFPAKMIEKYAALAPEEVKAMFRDLFDEDKDVVERIIDFKKQSDIIREKYDDPSINHYQGENAISIYLWLRYPEKYYIYKFGVAKTVADVLGSGYEFKQGDYVNNLHNFYGLYNEICEELKKDNELVSLLNKAKDNNCYPDNALHTMTIDFDVYIYQICKTPPKSIDSNDSDINYWIYSPGSNAYMWNEFSQKGIMGVGWDEMPIDLKTFSSKDEIKESLKKYKDETLSYMNAAHCLWQFANEMKIGDIVFAKRGMHKIIGKGVVISDYIYDADRETYRHIRKVNWQNIGEWEHPGQAVMKTLTNITSDSDYVQKLLEIVTDGGTEKLTYTKKDFLEEVYMSENTYDMLTELLEAKYNIILQGAPGVGKTFAAKRLAYSIMGKKDTSRVAMIQFHQSYSYEDFIQGYRPVENGFKLESGAFYKFCKTAEEDNENLYFFIIDEINRGNLSKILGELMMLIEKDKRGEKLKLLYSNEWFTVPKNVRIIGMMNTADRSLAMMDYALRRRFAFFDFAPAFASDGFTGYLEEKDSPKLKKLISVVESLNTAISNDESLGDGFRIGHSYFCTDNDITDGWLKSVVEYEVIPLLKEYWFDEPSKVIDWSANLRSAIK